MKNKTFYTLKVYLQNGGKDISRAMLAPEVHQQVKQLNKENASYIIQKIVPGKGDAPDEGDLVNVSLSEV